MTVGAEKPVLPTPASISTRTPTMTEVPPNLGREALMTAVAQEASAYARGVPPPGEVDRLVGRSFAIRVPFGCSGASADSGDSRDRDGQPGWSWGPDRDTIRISMTPGDWTTSPLIASGPTPVTWEAVEGFWIPRPWLVTDECPKIARDPLQPATAPSRQTLGIAAVFEAGGSRIGRRNRRAYTHTVRAERDAPLNAPVEGYRMLLAGRIVAFPNGRAIRCRAAGPDDRPVCIIAITLDRVAFEDAEGETLSEWRPG